jgi:aminoglycoside/choline kinase family phosphotransferase
VSDTSVQRFAALRKFLGNAGWGEAHATLVKGDASTRSYTRLTREEGAGADGGSETAILMDWPQAPDGPPIRDGRPYSQIAHLAENTRSFVAVAGALLEAGLAAPRIMAADYTHGFLLLEDFGDTAFTGLAAKAKAGDMLAYYRQAVDTLLVLRMHPPALELRADGVVHTLPLYDRDALLIETELLTDWLLPAIRGGEVPPEVRAEFTKSWDEQFDWFLAQPTGWVLRDYHSPNLMWREGESGMQRLGLIDFQDAVRGHLAYDLVSLLQDARLDLTETIEPELLAYYCDKAASADPAFIRDDFLRAYRLLGAQRNTKILGIFARLARRDGKRGYIQHMPRIARYLAADLADPALAGLRAWYERELPGDIATMTSRI